MARHDSVWLESVVMWHDLGRFERGSAGSSIAPAPGNEALWPIDGAVRGMENSCWPEKRVLRSFV